MNNYISIEETELGLKINLKAEGREELIKMRMNHSYEDIWKRLFRPLTKSSIKEYHIIKPEMVGCLPSAPVVGKGITVEPNGQMHFNDDMKMWWFPDYILVDEFEEMMKTGYVIFSKP